MVLTMYELLDFIPGLCVIMSIIITYLLYTYLEESYYDRDGWEERW